MKEGTRRYNPLLELVLARAREFYREPEAIFWVYVFPIILAVALGVAFRERAPEPVRVVVEDTGPEPSGTLTTAEAARRLSADPRFLVERLPPAEASLALARGMADLVVSAGGEVRYTYDPGRIEGRLARCLADEVLQGRQAPIPTVDRTVSEPGTRYIDFLIPGLIGLNIMGGGMWGVGFVIVDMRVRKLLKRFRATPMRKSDFLLSFAGGRLVFLLPEIAVLLLLGSLAFGVPMKGGIGAVAVISLASALSFSGLGLLAASRARKIETISGILNVVMLPMWLFSGVFFSADRFPGFLQPLIQALPLTASNDALRAVMLEGQPIASQAGEISILLVWGLVSFAVSLRLFRWS